MHRKSIICLMVFRLLTLCFAADLDSEFEKLRKSGIEYLRTMEEQRAAIDICLKFAQKYTRDPSRKDLVSEAYLLSGQIRRKIGLAQSDDAIADLSTGLDHDRNNADLNRELGLVYLDIEEWEEARNYLEIAVQLNDRDRPAWEGLVELSEKRGTAGQKLYAYKGYLQIDPSNAAYWTSVGTICLTLGKRAEADSSFVRAIGYDSQQTRAYLGLARLRGEKHDWKSVVIYCDKILEYEPGNEAAKALKAEAMPRLTKALEASELLSNARDALQRNDYQHWAEAEKRFEKLLEVDPQNEDGKDGLRDARSKLFHHWFSQGIHYKKRNLELALKCFTVSLVYADIDNDRNNAFAHQKEVAFSLNTEIKYKDAKEAANAALRTGQFRRALEALAAASFLYPSSSSEIDSSKRAAEAGEYYSHGLQEFEAANYGAAKEWFKAVLKIDREYERVGEYYAESDMRDKIVTVESEYQLAEKREDLQSARTYLKQLIRMVPDSLAHIYEGQLNVVDRTILTNRILTIIKVLIWIVGGITTFFLLVRFARFIIGLCRKHFSRIKIVPNKKFVAGLILVLGLCAIASVGFLTDFGSFMAKWSNDNQGILTLLSMVVSGFWAGWLFLEKRNSRN